MTRHPRRGQALLLFAILLPAVLLPVAALAAESVLVAERQARLGEAVVEAATAAALALDTGSLRAGTGWVLDQAAARSAAAEALTAADPGAVLDGAVLDGAQVTVSAHERVELRFAIFAPGRATLVRARVSARLTPGFARPG